MAPENANPERRVQRFGTFVEPHVAIHRSTFGSIPFQGGVEVLSNERTASLFSI
jgi:hypothetical protein